MYNSEALELVIQELAARRKRQNLSDRRLIEGYTAKNLRMLASPIHVYREQSNVRRLGRRGVNLTDYLSSPPQELEMQDDDGEYEVMDIGDSISGPTFFEGARVNSENLYDAYTSGSHSWSHPLGSASGRGSRASLSAVFAASTSSPEGSENGPDGQPPPLSQESLPPPPFPRARSSAWSGGSPASTGFYASSGPTSLTRQPSIRRSIRSRTVDFNDFASRRRSNWRSANDDVEDATQTFTWSQGNSGEGIGPNATASVGARRFFPLNRRRPDIAAPPGASMPSWLTDDSVARPVSPPGSLGIRPWRAVSAVPIISHIAGGLTEDAEPEVADRPRLRRGTIRAPESMLSRHASPVEADTTASPAPIAVAISQEAHSVTTPAPAPESDGDVGSQRTEIV